MKDAWIGHVLPRNCLLKHTSEGNIEGMGRRGRRLKHLPDDVKEKRWYWKLKQEALDGTLWRTSSTFREFPGHMSQMHLSL
jgi:hypothetical protein